jgi:hypothetical protein
MLKILFSLMPLLNGAWVNFLVDLLSIGRLGKWMQVLLHKLSIKVIQPIV